MTEYQKRILSTQEDFLKRESERYYKQIIRIKSYSKFRRFILGKVYNDLLEDCEETHKFNRENITRIAKLMMEKTFSLTHPS